MELRSLIREAPGRNRTDLSRLLADPEAFGELVRSLSEPFLNLGVTHVVGIEAMGLGLAGAVARDLGAGLILLRKEGRSAWDVSTTRCVDYTGQTKTFEIVTDVLAPTDRVLIVDDCSETGAQLGAAAELIDRTGATIIGASMINVDPLAKQRQPASVPILHGALVY